MEIAIIVIFGSVIFGFALLFLAIKIWRRVRRKNNPKRQFSQSNGSSGAVFIAEDNYSESEDYTDFSTLTPDEKTTDAVVEMSNNLSILQTETVSSAGEIKTDVTNSQSDSSWDYNSTESQVDSGSSSDSSSSCSSCGGGGD